MPIYVDFVPIIQLKKAVLELIESEYQSKKSFLKGAVEKYLEPHLNNLKEDLHCVISSPYIDKVYRDSYYHYYSSKLTDYNRDCIRVSFFSCDLSKEMFRDRDKVEVVKEHFLGFIVIRPTEPQIIGRSTINPKALKTNNFRCCTTKIACSVNAIKLEVEGFPHSSQDSETLSCAETTLWALMEYFASKYPEYRPVLPSEIINVLKQMSSERQLPSKGLSIRQMAYALKEFGFGTRLYSRDHYPNEFNRLISTYVESGIPIIIAVDNFHKGGAIGHAILTIGREEVIESKISSLKKIDNTDSDYFNRIINEQNISFYDFGDIKNSFIFIDDNRVSYQSAYLDHPVLHYEDERWHDCEINSFIVPLYPKIYLEAYEASTFCKDILVTFYCDKLKNKEIFFRFFLASSRSYKNYVALSPDFDNDSKDLILETSMSKFIWIAELSTKELVMKEKATGLIILDATEANTNNLKPLIFSSYQSETFIEDPKSHSIKNIELNLGVFSIYLNNLNAF